MKALMKALMKGINKNIKMIVVIAVVTVIALGVMLLLISGNEERDSVPVDPTEPHATDTSSETEKETTSAIEAKTSNEAQKLFDSKVETIGDSAAIAKLLETIDLKKNVAGYRVEIQEKEAPKSLMITLDTTVEQKERKNFDEDMQRYAEQILALVSDAEQVQWTYTVKADKRKEAVTVFLDTKGATDLLKMDVKKYGASVESVQILLDQQKGY